MLLSSPSKSALFACTLVVLQSACATPPDSGDVDPPIQCNFRSGAAEGAATTVNATLTSPSVPAIVANSVNVIDASIRNKIMTSNMSMTTGVTGLVQLGFQVINCTDYDLQVEGRTQFLDISEFPSEPVSGWTRLYLAPRSVTNYSASAISPDSSGFRVELREGD